MQFNKCRNKLFLSSKFVVGGKQRQYLCLTSPHVAFVKTKSSKLSNQDPDERLERQRQVSHVAL